MIFMISGRTIQNLGNLSRSGLVCSDRFFIQLASTQPFVPEAFPADNEEYCG